MKVRYGILLPGYHTIIAGINAPIKGIVKTHEGDETAICKPVGERELIVEIIC